MVAVALAGTGPMHGPVSVAGHIAASSTFNEGITALHAAGFSRDAAVGTTHRETGGWLEGYGAREAAGEGAGGGFPADGTGLSPLACCHSSTCTHTAHAAYSVMLAGILWLSLTCISRDSIIFYLSGDQSSLQIRRYAGHAIVAQPLSHQLGTEPPKLT